jgi:hypothetical protein
MGPPSSPPGGSLASPSPFLTNNNILRVADKAKPQQSSGEQEQKVKEIKQEQKKEKGKKKQSKNLPENTSQDDKKPSAATTSASETECIICLDSPRTHLIIPCFHLIACEDCIQNFAVGSECPVCRGNITDTKRIYSS